MFTEEEKAEMPHLEMMDEKSRRRTERLGAVLQTLGGLFFVAMALAPVVGVVWSVVVAMQGQLMLGAYLLLVSLLFILFWMYYGITRRTKTK